MDIFNAVMVSNRLLYKIVFIYGPCKDHSSLATSALIAQCAVSHRLNLNRLPAPCMGRYGREEILASALNSGSYGIMYCGL